MAGQQDEIPRIVYDLAEAFTQQSKFGNRIWLALVVAATLVLFPNTDNDGNTQLPFSLGTVDADTYKVVGFTILTVLLLAFCQAHARTHIAVRFAQSLIDKIKPERKRYQTRRLFDLLVVSSFARISALADLTEGPYVGAIYYIALKAVVSMVIFGIPAFAFAASYVRLIESASIPAWTNWLAHFAVIITSLAFLQILLLEVRHIGRVAGLYWSGQLIGKPSK